MRKKPIPSQHKERVEARRKKGVVRGWKESTRIPVPNDLQGRTWHPPPTRPLVCVPLTYLRGGRFILTLLSRLYLAESAWVALGRL